MSEIANPTLSRAEDLFKGLVWDSLINSVIAAIYVQAPWLGSWFFSRLTAGVVRMVGDKFFSHLRLIVDMQAIAFLNNKHRMAFDVAAVELRLVLRDKGSESKEFLDAKEKAKSALAEFVRFGATR